jgi:integrase
MRVAAIRAAFNWAQREGVIDSQPLGKFHGPGYTRRDHLPSDADASAILTYPNEAYVEFCTALINTGARPSEVSRVEAKDVDLERQCWTMLRHKNAKKAPAPRVVWLNAEMLALTAKLAKRNPAGPLFLNTRGGRWRADAVVGMFENLRRKLNIDSKVTAYTMRHWYITRALTQGVDISTVSAMCGTSIQTITKHYAHLLQCPRHMLAAVEKAKPSGAQA